MNKTIIVYSFAERDFLLLELTGQKLSRGHNGRRSLVRKGGGGGRDGWREGGREGGREVMID